MVYKEITQGASVTDCRAYLQCALALLAEARRRGVEIVVCPTAEAIQHLQEDPEETNAILHVTC